MPFEGKTVEMYREEFVRDVLAKTASFAALCRRYGISRPTGYLWLKRSRDGEGFHDRSHAPFKTPRKTAPAVEAAIVAARVKEPAVGAVKLHRMLTNSGAADTPSASTINAIFKRNGLITPEASRAATPHRRFEKEAPNVMWQADFKGNYLTQDGVRCHPLSLIDDHSRFCLCANTQSNERFPDTKENFLSTFRAYGLPNILLCDNGNPWGNAQTTGYTNFEFWLMDLGVLTIHIRAKHPQTQGKVEAFNGSFKRERLHFHTPLDMADAQAQRLEYRDFYNNVRPHHALELATPASRYCPSETPLPEKIVEWDYGADKTRLIKGTGFLTFEGQGYYLGEAASGRRVAVVPSSIDGCVNVIYRQFSLARINLNERAVVSRKVHLRRDDPRYV